MSYLNSKMALEQGEETAIIHKSLIKQGSVWIIFGFTIETWVIGFTDILFSTVPSVVPQKS